MRYCLVQDEDLHWYICRADKLKDASKYFERVARYWANLDNQSGPLPKTPNYLEEIGGHPSLVTFENPIITKSD